MQIQYFSEQDESVTVPEMRGALRLGFERSGIRRKREFVYTVERAAPVIEGPHFNITQMTPEDLERLPPFHYYG